MYIVLEDKTLEIDVFDCLGFWKDTSKKDAVVTVCKYLYKEWNNF